MMTDTTYILVGFAVLWPLTVAAWALFSYLVWFHPYRRAKRLSGPPRDARGRFTRTPDSK